jgi:Outer membrane protein beta-barrel family
LQKNKLGLVKLSSSYKPNTKVQFDYDVLLKKSAQGETTDVLSVTEAGADNIHEARQQEPFSVNQNANLYYTLNEKNIFSVEAQHLYQNEDPFYNAIRTQQPFAGIIPTDNTQSDYNVNQERRVKTNKLEAKIDYYYVTGPKSNINFTLGTTASRQRFNSAIFQILDDNSTLNFTDEALNNNVSYNFTDVYLGFHYKVISGIFTFTPGFTAHRYKATNEQLGSSVSDDLFNVVPDVYINVQLKKSENIRFNYSITREFTDVTKFASGYLFNNYNTLYQGNRNLESALYHNLSLNYFSFNMFNYTNIFAALSYNKRINAFKSSSAIDGINQVNAAINSNFEDDIISASGRFERTFGKLKTATRAAVSYAKLNNLINLEPRISESFTQNYELGLSTNFKKIPNVEIGYNYTINEYDNGGALTTNYTDRPFIKVDAAFLKGFVFTADYSYYHFRSKDNSIANQYGFLNSNLSYQKKDSKWEYSINITNLLNNKDLNQDSFSELFTTTSQYIVQPRYMMFTVKYDL